MITGQGGVGCAEREDAFARKRRPGYEAAPYSGEWRF
jgi:hypothetical protein